MVDLGARPRGGVVTAGAICRGRRVVSGFPLGFGSVMATGAIGAAAERAMVHPRATPLGRAVASRAIGLRRDVTARLARREGAIVATGAIGCLSEPTMIYLGICPLRCAVAIAARQVGRHGKVRCGFASGLGAVVASFTGARQYASVIEFARGGPDCCAVTAVA